MSGEENSSLANEKDELVVGKKKKTLSENEENSSQDDENDNSQSKRNLAERTKPSKRSFNVESLLAPDINNTSSSSSSISSSCSSSSSSSCSATKRLKSLKAVACYENKSTVPKRKKTEMVTSRRGSGWTNQHNNSKQQCLTRGCKASKTTTVLPPAPTIVQRTSSSSNAGLGCFIEHNSHSPFSKIESDNQDVEKWKQTFSKIMARSYKNNNGAVTSTSTTASSIKK